MVEVIKKKRGRKPKNYCTTKLESLESINENINTDEEKIIFHIPITIDEINDTYNNDISMFISNNNNVNIINNNANNSNSSEINTTINQNKFIINNINKVVTHICTFTKNTKCWWCKNLFITPSVQLPEDYFNDTFFCIGHFCSFNCMKSYNLDLNDSLIYKRDSLINLLYYLTYSEYKNIVRAPHWLTLNEFGGPLTLEMFRENINFNTTDYLILHPPLISRQMQIEESYKINKLKEVHIDKINKIYSEIDSDYLIKRNKNLPASHLNLETTMGLIKTKKKY
jgi:hypothetical protein|uniref:Uncharacterized protein n=1 Tax=viral metagenome TaxID=1070528 RepID=A0A6C0EDM2_9ZZZZ